MIAQLTGAVSAREGATCVVDVGGVGYLVHCSTRTLAALPERATVLTEMQVREDAITLYGFADAAERDWFRLLITVQGVGGRVALAILSTLGARDLAAAIATADKAALGRAPGVGPKLAIRLATELRDKAAALPQAGRAAPARAAEASAAEDAISALGNLGYRRAEAEQAVARAQLRLGEPASLDALIRDGLKELGPR